jgi:hypothetical protein
MAEITPPTPMIIFSALAAMALVAALNIIPPLKEKVKA